MNSIQLVEIVILKYPTRKLRIKMSKTRSWNMFHILITWDVTFHLNVMII